MRKRWGEEIVGVMVVLGVVVSTITVTMVVNNWMKEEEDKTLIKGRRERGKYRKRQREMKRKKDEERERNIQDKY